MTREHTYTAEEADALVPELAERLVRIRAARQVLFREAELVRERVVADGGGGDAGRAYWDSTAVLRAELQRLSEQDILLRDPETGLVDFPSEREGLRVFLCWRLGEERVAHWHPLDTGFSSRRPL